MDRYATARSRGVLARVQTLRLERRTRDAQRLWSLVEAGAVEGTRVDRAAGRDTPAVVLGEQAAIERALLLLRQEDDGRYREALAILDESRERLLGVPGRVEPCLSGDRQRRLVARLSTAYSLAGRESDANGLAAWILGAPASSRAAWREWDADRWRRLTAPLPDIRAADQLGNISVRAARLAYIELLGSPEGGVVRARELLRVAHVTATVSLEKRHSPHGEGISRRALLGVEFHRYRVDGGSREALEALTSRIWEFVVASHAVPANGRASLMSRHAFYGQALVEVAKLAGEAERESTALLARVALRPMVGVHELDAVYDHAIDVAYGDACALSRDVGRARQAWKRVLVHLRRARPASEAAAAAMERRLDGGSVPPRG